MSTYYLSRGDAAMIFHRDHVTDHDRKPVTDSWRPVVVIDPEAASDADLAPLLSIGTVENARDVLRAMLNPTPPKPEEPTGLGAVVEDAEGVRWVRRSSHPARSWSADTGSFQRAADYADINAVRVIAEGVTA